MLLSLRIRASHLRKTLQIPLLTDIATLEMAHKTCTRPKKAIERIVSPNLRYAGSDEDEDLDVTAHSH